MDQRLIKADIWLVSKIQIRTGCTEKVAKEIVDAMTTVNAVPKEEVDKAFQDGYEKGYHRAQLDYGLEDDKEKADKAESEDKE